jgi:hypothetical protein
MQSELEKLSTEHDSSSISPSILSPSTQHGLYQHQVAASDGSRQRDSYIAESSDTRFSKPSGLDGNIDIKLNHSLPNDNVTRLMDDNVVETTHVSVQGKSVGKQARLEPGPTLLTIPNGKTPTWVCGID